MGQILYGQDQASVQNEGFANAPYNSICGGHNEQNICRQRMSLTGLWMTVLCSVGKAFMPLSFRSFVRSPLISTWNCRHASGPESAIIITKSLSKNSPSSQNSPISLYALTDDELSTLLSTWDEKPYRVQQIRQWISAGTTDFDSMSNLPRRLREKLKSCVTLHTLDLVAEQISTDGTIKRVYALQDGQLIESVLMIYKDGRRTACLSSQAGCAMGCVFCATGQMGYRRQLRAHEIFEQAARFDTLLKARGDRLTNVGPESPPQKSFSS